MITDKPPIQAEASNSAKMMQTMVGIGVLCALLIVLTYQGTLPRIERLKAEALEKAIFKVLPGIASKETFILNSDNQFVKSVDAKATDQKVYAGYSANHELVGLAIEASGIGFADVIRVLYGYDLNQEKVIGFYVLESKETPGLGDKIAKDPGFLANFEALEATLSQDESAVQNRIVTVKHGEKEHAWEIDAITGATISSRAIGNILGESTAKWAPLIAKQKDAFSDTGALQNESEGK